MASRVPARIGWRFSFEAAPWAVCLAPVLAALRTNLPFNELLMEPLYPRRSNADLIRGLATASIAFAGLALAIGLPVVHGSPGKLSALGPATRRARRRGA